MQGVRYILIGIICSIPSMVHIGVKIAIGPASELPIDRAGQARPIKREPGTEDGRKGERRRGYWQVGEEDKAV